MSGGDVALTLRAVADFNYALDYPQHQELVDLLADYTASHAVSANISTHTEHTHTYTHTLRH
jgi:hypothetical protein